MGYRNDVTLTIRTNDFYNLLKSADSENIKILEFITENADTYHTTKYVTIHWGWIKWCEDCPEIKFIKDFADELDVKSYVFKRLRDDITDAKVS